MGEYARYAGNQIKIGTCENMYYLRANQRHLVTAIERNVDPSRDETLRYRFPWPDEDTLLPGDYDKPGRSVALPGVELPAELEHGTVQFRSDRGYLVSLPCPEGPAKHNLLVHRNGFSGAVQIVQQRVCGKRTLLICQCGGCGYKYNLPTWEDAKPYVDACERQAAANYSEHSAKWWLEVAVRIARGYGQE